MPGRSYQSSTPYRYGMQGQEKDDEIVGSGNHIDFKFRGYDPRLGRFWSVDPLAHEFPWNSPYAFSENRVIDSRELEGLEKVSVHTYAFAPFDRFGGGFHGDGANRQFGDAISYTYGKENFRIGAQATIDLQTSKLVMEKSAAYGALSTHLPTGVSAYSEANFDDLDFDDGSLFFHVQGNNDAFLWGSTPDIDVKVNANFRKVSEGLFNVSGEVYGDRFPSNESFLTDELGNKLFLGVSGPDNNGANVGPFTELLGTAFESMQKFNFYVTFNKDNSFNSVIHNGKSYTLEDWNKQFTNLSPTSEGTGTNLTPTEFNCDYDPN
jgi:RHS repeat-associated protein